MKIEVVTIKKISLSEAEVHEAIKLFVKASYGAGVNSIDDYTVTQNVDGVFRVEVACDSTVVDPKEALHPEQMIKDLEAGFKPSDLDGGDDDMV